MVKRRYKKSEDVREQILDAAEELFARHGFAATSTRQITSAAGVRNASINYHFATKEALGVAVVERRFDKLRLAREARLNALDIDAANANEALRGIVDAFVIPLAELTRTGGQGWTHYNRIAAQYAVSGDWPEHPYTEKVDTAALLFITALKDCAPHATFAQAVLGYQFMLGTVLSTFAENPRFAGMNQNATQTDQADDRTEALIVFVAAGLERFLAGPSLEGA